MILAFSVLLIKLIGLNPVFEIIVSSILSLGVYLGLAALLKIDEFNEIRYVLLNLIKKRSITSDKH